MKITVLMEDRDDGSNFIHEHGLSFYIETKKHKLLFDTGQSEKTWENARMSGIDLTKVDTVIISHGHYDHAGGVLSFVKINPDAKIYMNQKAVGDYYHFKNNEEKYIGIDHNIEKLSQLVLLDGNSDLDEELSIFTHINGRRLWPDGNMTLHKRINQNYVQDCFDHEQCLVIHEGDKEVLLSGCAHNGILNILDCYQNIYHRYPDVVFSGFHMQKSNGYTPEDLKNIHLTARELQLIPSHFYTGHCTGVIPYDVMKEVMGDQLDYMYTGKTIEI